MYIYIYIIYYILYIYIYGSMHLMLGSQRTARCRVQVGGVLARRWYNQDAGCSQPDSQGLQQGPAVGPWPWASAVPSGSQHGWSSRTTLKTFVSCRRNVMFWKKRLPCRRNTYFWWGTFWTQPGSSKKSIKNSSFFDIFSDLEKYIWWKSANNGRHTWKSSNLLRETMTFHPKSSKTRYFCILFGPHMRKVAPLMNSSGSTVRDGQLWPDEFVFSRLGIRHLPIASRKVQNPNSTPQRTKWTRQPKPQRALNI